MGIWGNDYVREQNLAARLATFSLIAVAVLVIGFALSTGYGAGHSAISNQEYLAQQAKKYQPSQVAVIYERTLNGEQDFLHLKIDTTYHKIGKGGYTREVLCNRDFSLRAFNGSYHNLDKVVAQCFVEGDATKEWQTKQATKTIVAYTCQRAVANMADRQWEAWYTNQLPYVADEARVTDNYKGLILEARDAEGKYELKARYITQYIG